MQLAQRTELKVGSYGMKTGVATHSLQKNAYMMGHVPNFQGSVRVSYKTPQSSDGHDFLGNSFASTSTTDTTPERTRSRCSSGGIDVAPAPRKLSSTILNAKMLEASAPTAPLSPRRQSRALWSSTSPAEAAKSGYIQTGPARTSPFSRCLSPVRPLNTKETEKTRAACSSPPPSRLSPAKPRKTTAPGESQQERKVFPVPTPTPAVAAVRPARGQPQQQQQQRSETLTRASLSKQLLDNCRSLPLPTFSSPRSSVRPAHASTTPKTSDQAEAATAKSAGAVVRTNEEVEVAIPDVTATAIKEPIQIALPNAMMMTIEELQTKQIGFDPSQPELRSQLLQRLGFAQTAVIEKLPDNCGSFNNGVWSLTDTNSLGVMLKLVPAQRAHVYRATDTDKYLKVQSQCPNIAQDYSMSFPLKILQLKGPCGIRSKDLIVMRIAPGKQLTVHMFNSIKLGNGAGSIAALLEVMKGFGKFLKTIHRVYKGMQHGDCQASNIFYDESTREFTLIDVADFGYEPKMAVGGDDDVEHFAAGLMSLSEHYGKDLMVECTKLFRAGYSESQ